MLRDLGAAGRPQAVRRFVAEMLGMERSAVRELPGAIGQISELGDRYPQV
jgi:hypothetical protein